MLRLIALTLLAVSTNVIGAEFAGSFAPKNLEFGEIYEFGTASVDVELQNISNFALDISRIDSARPDVMATVSKKHVEPGQTVRLTANFPTLDRIGRVSFHLDLFTESSKTPDTRIVLRGFVDWIVDPSSTIVDLGAVDARAGVEKSVSISARPGEELKLVSVESQGNFVDAVIEPGGKAIRISTKKNVPWGLFSDKVHVRTDNSKQPKVVFTVGADVRGDVVPSFNPLEIGVVEATKGIHERLRLNGPEGKKLKIGSVKIDGQYVRAVVADCVPKLISCAEIRLTADSLPEKSTSLSEMLRIELPDYKQVLPVALNAMIVKPGTTVRNLNEEMSKAEEAPVSISSIMKSATLKPEEMKRPDGNGPLLSWRVANEWGVYGYEIYRSQFESEDYERVNDKIIRRISGLDQATGSIYHWRDSGAVSGAVYWYKILIVYDSGRKQELSSPQRVVAK